jgi:hypothetical protein
MRKQTGVKSLNLILLQNMLLFSKGIFGYFHWHGTGLKGGLGLKMNSASIGIMFNHD